jgi:hypothetical protein
MSVYVCVLSTRDVGRSTNPPKPSAWLEVAVEPADEEHRVSDVGLHRGLFTSGKLDHVSISLRLRSEIVRCCRRARDRSVAGGHPAGPVIAFSPSEESPGVVDIRSPGAVSHTCSSTGGFVSEKFGPQPLVVPCPGGLLGDPARSARRAGLRIGPGRTLTLEEASQRVPDGVGKGATAVLGQRAEGVEGSPIDSNRNHHARSARARRHCVLGDQVAGIADNFLLICGQIRRFVFVLHRHQARSAPFVSQAV